MCEPQWQPIETAPKDGTEMLVMAGDSPRFMTIAFFDDGLLYSDWDHAEIHSKPTHWLPLPTPPKD